MGTFSPLTVLMPAHREGAFLVRALRSVQAQSVREWQMILVLDSPDSQTESIGKRFARQDARIRFLRVDFSNIGAALHEGIEQAHSEFILRMDADDISHPTRFQRQLAFMYEQPQTVASGSNARLVDRHGFAFHKSEVALDHSEILADLLRGNGSAILHPTAIFRRDALIRAGNYATDLPRGEDLDLYLRMSDQGKLANQETCLIDFRKHEKSYTAAAARSAEVQSESLIIRETLIRTYLTRHGKGTDPLKLDQIGTVSSDDFHAHVLSKAFQNRRWAIFSLYLIRTLFSVQRFVTVWREVARQFSNRTAE